MERPGPAPRHLALVGVTASGKSAVAMALARRLGDVEIVAVDSMQVYRGMDVGTAKPTADEQADVRHHGIDLVDPWHEFTVRDYQQAAEGALTGIEARGNRPLLVGGTGLYLQAVVDRLEIPGRWPHVRAELDAEPDTVALHTRLADLDPLAAARMEPTNRRRVLRALEVTLGSGRPFSSFGPGLDAYPETRFDVVGLRMPTDVTAARIDDRYRWQLANGFADEARRLLDPSPGCTLSRTAGQALGYRELLAHLRGEMSLDEAVALAVRRTRSFARRQRAWFRRDPRITWIDVGDDPLVAVDHLTRRWRVGGGGGGGNGKSRGEVATPPARLDPP